MGPARDLADFSHAATLFAANRNPYSDPRFVTPPFSLCVGMLSKAAGAHAAVLFFACNLLLLAGGLYKVSMHFGVGAFRGGFLLLCACCFYPVFFLLDRGNIDGLLFLLFVWSLASESMWVRALALGLGNNLKLYTLLPSAYGAWRNGRRFAVLVLASTLLCSLPLAHWDASFLHNLLHRTSLATGTENMSPSLILGASLKSPEGKASYLLLWLVSVSAAAKRLSRIEKSRASARLVPWMIALPFQVYPYSGVLLLITYADWLSSSRKISSTTSDWLVTAGLCMVGVQQQALTDLFGALVHSHRLFPFFNALGVLLLAISVQMSVRSEHSRRHCNER